MRRLVVALVAVALVAAACSDDPATETTTSTTQPTTTTTFGGTTTTEGSAASVTTTTEAPQLKPYGGEFRMLNRWTAASTVNPFIDVSDGLQGSNEHLRNLHTAGAWARDHTTGDAVPDLITELPTVENGRLVLNDDGSLTVRLTVDSEAVWSDGEPITADDFLFTYEVLVDPANLSREFATVTGDVAVAELAYPLRRQIGPQEWGEPFVRAGSVTAEGQDFEFTLEEPMVWFQESLFQIVLPRHAVEGTDIFEDWNDRLWPSAGPFVLASWDWEAHTGIFERNPRYWRSDPETGQQLPYLDRIVVSAYLDEIAARVSDDLRPFVEAVFDQYPVAGEVTVGAVADDLGLDEGMIERFFVEADAAELELLRDGVIHNIYFFIIRPEYPALGDEPGITFRTVKSPLWESIAFNYSDGRAALNEGSLIEHLDFRRAIAHAIDREALSQRVYGQLVTPLDSLVDTFSPTVGGEGWGRYDHDPDEARRLIGDLCDRLGRDCEADPPRLIFQAALWRPDHRAVAEGLTEMLGDVGIVVEASAAPFDDLFGCREWEASTWAWQTAGILPVLSAYEVFSPQLNQYWWGIDDTVDSRTDDPETECNESNSNSGPSVLLDEFSQRFDEILGIVRSASDLAGLDAAILEMEEILSSQVIVIPLYARPNFELYRSDLIAGYGYEFWSIFPQVAFWNADRWYRKDL